LLLDNIRPQKSDAAGEFTCLAHGQPRGRVVNPAPVQLLTKPQGGRPAAPEPKLPLRLCACTQHRQLSLRQSVRPTARLAPVTRRVRKSPRP
jgi:hypothetical protein